MIVRTVGGASTRLFAVRDLALLAGRSDVDGQADRVPLSVPEPGDQPGQGSSVLGDASG